VDVVSIHRPATGRLSLESPALVVEPVRGLHELGPLLRSQHLCRIGERIHHLARHPIGELELRLADLL
jgi:hypothetical protein